MSETHIILWSIVILEVTLALLTGGTNNNEGTDNVALQLLSVSPTTISMQWMCTAMHNHTVTWKGMIRNAMEKWERTDTKVFDLCQNVNNFGQEVNTTITDLEEGVEYNFSVDGLGLANFNTLTSVPSGPPIYLRARPVNPATMHISWIRPKLLDCNGDILRYIIMVDSDSDEHNYTFNVTSQCVSTTSTDVQCLSHSFNVPKNDLMPHEKYSVKVAAVNVNGVGPFSNVIVATSGDDVPGPPENLQVTHSDEAPDEFILQWDMPRNPNGAILGYQIRYGITGDTTNSQGAYTYSLNYTLKLSGNATYTISVYAVTSAGVGSAAKIQWPSSDDSRNSDVGNNSNSSTGGSNELKDYKKFIVGGCVGIFILILLICAIVCIRSKYKRYKTRRSSAADIGHFPVNAHNVYAERGCNSLPYDYPYTEANGAEATSATTFQPQAVIKHNGTCIYTAVVNGNSKSCSATSAVRTSSRNMSKRANANTRHISASQNDLKALLSPPAGSARVTTKANNDNQH